MTSRGRLRCENDEFCIKHEEFGIKVTQNEELCIKNEEFCIENDEFCRTRRCSRRWMVRVTCHCTTSPLPTWRCRL